MVPESSAEEREITVIDPIESFRLIVGSKSNSSVGCGDLIRFKHSELLKGRPKVREFESSGFVKGNLDAVLSCCVNDCCGSLALDLASEA